MKTLPLIRTGLAALALLITAISARALETNVVSFNLTGMAQGGTNTVNGISTVSTTKLQLTTKSLLNDILEDEKAAGLYTNASFPAGSQLVVFINDTNDNASFAMINKSGQTLVSVTNLFTVVAGSNVVHSAIFNDSTKLYAPYLKRSRLVYLTYDDAAITNGMHLFFRVQGLESKLILNSAPKAGSFTATDVTVVNNAVGEGLTNGNQFVITGGSFGYVGKETLPVP